MSPRTRAEGLFCYYPCPCGWYGDPVKECTCSNNMVSRYQKRISGALLDRSDFHIKVPRVEYEKLSDERMGRYNRYVIRRTTGLELLSFTSTSQRLPQS